MSKQVAWRKGNQSTTVVSDVLPLDAVPGSSDEEAYGGYLIAESVAPSMVPLISAAPELLAACKAQHEAIDRLFAMLILATNRKVIDHHAAEQFLPTKSGQPWEALLQGNEAIKKAEAKTATEVKPCPSLI